MKAWTFWIVAAWVAVISLSDIRASLPATWWFRPEPPVFTDAPQGTCPQFDWQREIRRPFYGRWLAVLQRETANGGWRYYTRYSGESNYLPDAALPAPENRTLAWYFDTDAAHCIWPPGTYRVVTSWTVYPKKGPARVVTVISPPFRITAER